MTILLDTDLVSAPERIDALHGAYDGESPQREVIVAAHPVRHRVERVDVGPEAHLLRTGGTALQFIRTAHQVRRDAPEYVAIGLHRRGDALMLTTGADTDVPVGHLLCVDLTRPYRMVHRTSYNHDVLFLSNRELGVSVDVVRAAVPALARSPVYDLVRGHLVGLFAAVCGLPTAPRLLTGRATTALIAALLNTAAATQGSVDAMDDALEARINLYLDAHLGDRDLTVESAAAAHNVSVRQFYNVWAQTGHDHTPAQWITQRRLQRAREQLSGSDPHRVSIAAVARQWGFADSSHFSRRFRETFGVSPREWRGTARPAAPGGEPSVVG